LLVAALLLLATPVVFGIASAASKERWDTILAQKKDDLEQHGLTADATVVHRVKTYITIEPVTKYVADPNTGYRRPKIEYEVKTHYIDQFEFRFTPQHGVEVTKTLEFPRESWNEQERFFDPGKLRGDVEARGEVLEKASWFTTPVYQLKHVQ